ncbi:MAG: nucleotide exchange factor GrpE [Nitrospira sp.]|jgi:molecular chaperone GrpE|nr:nucleotide exchange factor GrpE [Nitrospira sp.]
MGGKKHAEKKRAEPSVGPQTSMKDSQGARQPAPAAAGAARGGAKPQREARLESELTQLQAELEATRLKAEEELDKFLRAKAEVDNVRRRAEIDVANACKYGIERLATEMLAVCDSLELARTVDIEQENQIALAKMHEGLDLTLKLMDSVFKKFSLSVINPEHAKFDPERHQAVGMVESEQVPPGHVVQVVQKGYLLHDRLLRPAMVIVAKARGADKNGDSNP